MAQIELKTIRRINKDRNTIHARVQTTYSTFEVNGEKYLQIDTYGKSDREIPGKISQSIQLEKESAKFFAELLKREFNLKD